MGMRAFAPFSAVLAKRALLRAIPLGDSITQSNSAVSGGGVWTLSNGYAEATLMKGGGRFQVLSNAGVSGQTAAQILSRVITDVIAKGADVCLLQSGTNDLPTCGTNAGITALMNTLEQTVRTLLNAGVAVILTTPPANNNYPVACRNVQRFYYMLAQYYGLPLLDMFRLTVDASTGNYKATLSADGTHPNDLGAQTISDAFGASLANPGSLIAPVYLAGFSEAASNNQANMLQNGSFAAGGTNPTGWGPNFTGATGASAAAAAPYTGNTFTYTKSSGTGAYALFGAGASSASYSAGDTLVYSGHLKVTGLAASPNGYTAALAFDSGGTAAPINQVKTNGEYVFCQEIVAPATPGNATPQLFVQDVGVYAVNNFTLWNKTTSEAIWKPGQM
jgi:lysophospholipase L1-like esterase